MLFCREKRKVLSDGSRDAAKADGCAVCDLPPLFFEKQPFKFPTAHFHRPQCAVVDVPPFVSLCYQDVSSFEAEE